jgi:hypothetical protein
MQDMLNILKVLRRVELDYSLLWFIPILKHEELLWLAVVFVAI